MVRRRVLGQDEIPVAVTHADPKFLCQRPESQVQTGLFGRLLSKYNRQLSTIAVCQLRPAYLVSFLVERMQHYARAAPV